MRKLNTKDAVCFMRLMKKTGVRQIVVNLVDDVKQKKESGEADNVQKIGINAVFALLEGVTTVEAEKELYVFLSGPFEKTPEEVETMDLEELMNGLEILAKENNLESFFTSAFGTTITG